MQITITIEQLVQAGACDEAIAEFRSLYGESGTENWTRERQIELLKGPLGKFLAWAWQNNLVPLWNLYRANLSGTNLYRANLSGTNLSGTNLSGTNLSGTNLSGANLSRANLSRANLSRADLSGANLSGADLSGADLSRANLSRANLSGANLSGANLYDCYWPEDAPEGWKKDENGRLKRKATANV